jgi:uncharacterized protein YndB with AHSA1/START domain
MARLYLEKSIQIDAPAARVWNVLTDAGLTRQWIRQWWPDLEVLESSWRLGDPVLWRVAGGAVGARGEIWAIQPPVRLTFGFQAIKPAFPPHQEQITYRLTERAGRTHLQVMVGDFGDTPEHERCYPGAVDSWDRSLPKIKELSEKR